MQALILCGGQGIRAWPATAEVPKPMLEIGGRPVLHHLMASFAGNGVTSFVLAAGYRYEVIEQYAAGLHEPWQVHVVDTGDDTDTGERVRRCLNQLDDTFFATYGDGLGDVDLPALRRRHDEHRGAATMTVVPLPSPYGTVVLAGDGQVVEFTEKPRLTDHLINAGFFVFDRDAIAGTSGASLERDILPTLSGRGELFVYRHDGFWRSMDTSKDVADLNAIADKLAGQEELPWLHRAGSRADVS